MSFPPTYFVCFLPSLCPFLFFLPSYLICVLHTFICILPSSCWSFSLLLYIASFFPSLCPSPFFLCVISSYLFVLPSFLDVLPSLCPYFLGESSSFHKGEKTLESWTWKYFILFFLTLMESESEPWWAGLSISTPWVSVFQNQNGNFFFLASDKKLLFPSFSQLASGARHNWVILLFNQLEKTQGTPTHNCIWNCNVLYPNNEHFLLSLERRTCGALRCYRLLAKKKHLNCWSDGWLIDLNSREVHKHTSTVWVMCAFFFSVRKDEYTKRIYIGSMKIENQVFDNAYENSNTREFKALDEKVQQEVRLPSSLTRYTNTFFYFYCLNMKRQSKRD